MGGKYLSYASSVGEINRPGRWHGMEKSTQVCCMAVFVEIPRYLLLPLSC